LLLSDRDGAPLAPVYQALQAADGLFRSSHQTACSAAATSACSRSIPWSPTWTGCWAR
jgi:hypothetical protein